MVKQFIFEQSCRLEQTGVLLLLVEQYLKEHHILRPATSTLRRIVGEQKTEARQYIFEKILSSLPKDTQRQIDLLLEVETSQASWLQRLKAVPRKPSPAALKQLTQKLEQISQTGALGVDLSWLNNNYQRSLANYVKICSAYRLRELSQPHHYAALTCFLWQTYRDTIDQIVDMYDKLVNKVYNWAEEDLIEEIKRQRQSIQDSLAMFQTVGKVILNSDVEDAAVRKTIFRKIKKEELAKQISQCSKLTITKSNHLFLGVLYRFSYLRQISKPLLEHLEFLAEPGGNSEVIRAIEVLRKMNRSGKRKLPSDVPTSFVPKKLRSLVVQEGEINKQAWECALLTVIRDEIKSANLSVATSKRFSSFDNLFISDSRWQAMRENFFAEAGLPCLSNNVGDYLKNRLNQAYDYFLSSLPNNTYAQVDSNGWRLSTDPAEKLSPLEEAKLEHLKSWLKMQMRPIKLPELLIEIDNELHFTHHFMTPAQQQMRRVSDVCSVLATIMAHGCNIGPYTMSRMTPGITYEDIQRITDWQLNEETQRGALASVVNAIANLDTSQTWGEGKTSASDGQRFAFPRKVLQQTFSPRFSDFALEFYAFVADNYAPFYSTPIECTDRDAAYVLDGLLYNESDLELEEHYTDTHGYTEINFAAFAMLGKRFCPRIKGLHRQRIYRINLEKDYGPLEPLVNRQDRTVKIDWIVDQWDRMGQFYATLKSGHTTASVALKRLNSMSRKNQFYRANRELGRVFKTEFMLQYMSQPPLRRQVRRGLLKIEQLHSLARDVAYGKRGRITVRDFHEMMRTCSCLTLILACIIYWQASEIGRVVAECLKEADGIDISLLQHVSPIEWDNVVLYGEYVIDPNLIR